MKKLFIFLLIMFSASARLYPSQLEYVGAFQMPAGVSAYALAFNPDGDPSSTDDYPGSLYGNEKYTSDGMVTEFSIPVPLVSPDKIKGELPTPVMLNGPADITNDAVDGEYTGCNMAGLEYIDKLYWTRMTYYVSPCNTVIGRSSAQLSEPEGLWKLEYPEAMYNHYIFEIPLAWAQKYTDGRNIAYGRYREGGGNSGGPGIFAVADWGDMPVNSTIDSTPLLYYERKNYEYLGYMADFANNDRWWDAVWLDEAIIFSGSKATRSRESGTGYYGGPLPDSCGSSGYHSDPAYPALRFYDPDDIAKVAQGTMEAYEPQPYATMQLENYIFEEKRSCNNGGQLAGIAVDNENQLLYVAEPKSYSASRNSDVIHVFRIVDAVEDTEPPNAPGSLTATRGDDIELTWDHDENVMFIVYRKGRPKGLMDSTQTGITYTDEEFAPIHITKGTSFTDSNYIYFPAPYTYIVEAVDSSGNRNSEEVTVDADDIDFDVSGFLDRGYASVRHALPDMLNGSYFEFQFSAYGGTPPYEWSASFLTPGLSLDSSTGLLSGVPELYSCSGYCKTDIIVEDSAGNIAALYLMNYRIMTASPDILELIEYLMKWRRGEITTAFLLEKINAWKG